jgi:hypothetical protein
VAGEIVAAGGDAAAFVTDKTVVHELLAVIVNAARRKPALPGTSTKCL